MLDIEVYQKFNTVKIDRLKKYAKTIITSPNIKTCNIKQKKESVKSFEKQNINNIYTSFVVLPSIVSMNK